MTIKEPVKLCRIASEGNGSAITEAIVDNVEVHPIHKHTVHASS